MAGAGDPRLALPDDLPRGKRTGDPRPLPGRGRPGTRNRERNLDEMTGEPETLTPPAPADAEPASGARAW